MPIQERDDGDYLVLTKRAEHLNRHRGQIAFPGGRIDAGDAGELEAALRESEEEIGLDPSHVKILGRIDQVMAAYARGADNELPADRDVARSLIAPESGALRDFSHLAPEIP